MLMSSAPIDSSQSRHFMQSPPSDAQSPASWSISTTKTLSSPCSTMQSMKLLTLFSQMYPLGAGRTSSTHSLSFVVLSLIACCQAFRWPRARNASLIFESKVFLSCLVLRIMQSPSAFPASIDSSSPLWTSSMTASPSVSRAAVSVGIYNAISLASESYASLQSCFTSQSSLQPKYSLNSSTYDVGSNFCFDSFTIDTSLYGPSTTSKLQGSYLPCISWFFIQSFASLEELKDAIQIPSSSSSVNLTFHSLAIQFPLDQWFA